MPTSALSLPQAEIQLLAFVNEAPAGQSVVLNLPDPIRRSVIRVAGAGTPSDLSILSAVVVDLDDPGLAQSLRDWVEAGGSADAAPTHTLMLQGVQIAWRPGRVAFACVYPDRLDSIRKAVIEACYYDAELRSLERELGEGWTTLEADAPLAFEFSERSVRKRPQLAQRFQKVLSYRARLARITPHVLCPHVHPPTLASQVSERIRERTRMAHRLEFIGGQLEVFERVYDSCSQRASDFMLTRKTSTLEWIIIILLLMEVILLSFDLMLNMRK